MNDAHHHLSELSNTHHMDEYFGIDHSSNFAGHTGGGGHPHTGGGGHFPRPYPIYPLYPNPYGAIWQEPIVYTQPARRVQITKLGLAFMKRKKGESIVPEKEDAILWQLREGKQMLEMNLKQILGYTDFDVLLNWLAAKGYVNVV